MQEGFMKLWKHMSLMPKGHKRTKGVPELHDELKTRINLSLTPTAVEGLDAIATELGISRSELVERIGRRKILLASQSDLGNVDPEVYAFIEQAVRDLPLIDISRSAIKVVVFRERHKAPSSPGAYILSDWRLALPGTAQNLREKFLSEDFVATNQRFIENLENSSFILWQSFQDSRILEDEKLALQDVSDVYQKLKKEVITRALQKAVEKMSLESLNKETQDSNFLAS